MDFNLDNFLEDLTNVDNILTRTTSPETWEVNYFLEEIMRMERKKLSTVTARPMPPPPHAAGNSMPETPQRPRPPPPPPITSCARLVPPTQGNPKEDRPQRSGGAVSANLDVFG